MANGTIDERIARADRLREERERVSRAAEQNRRGMQNAADAIRRAALESYTGDDEVSEVTADIRGVRAKAPLPHTARLAIGISLAAGILAVLVAIGWRIAH